MALTSKFLRFSIVGTLAAFVHVSTVVVLVHFAHLHPLIANIGGFLLSFQVSYFGSRHWTFAESSVGHSIALPRLFSLQVLNFFANEAMFYLLLSLHLPYFIALVMVLSILPIFTFTMSHLWVFKTA